MEGFLYGFKFLRSKYLKAETSSSIQEELFYYPKIKIMTKGTTFVPIPGENTQLCKNNTAGKTPVELSIQASNEALLRVLDSGNYSEDDISVIEKNTGKVLIEDLLDTIVEKSDINDSLGIKKLRSDTKSRILGSLQKLGLLESHIEGPKRKNSSDIIDKRSLIIDKELIHTISLKK